MSPAVLGLLADLLAFVHLGFVAFVLFGELLILVGAFAGWGWIRNPWLRLGHLAAIVVVALEALCGIVCPLTVWENELRRAAGQHVADGSFVGRLIQRLLYYDVPEHVFRVVYVAFAALVMATFVLAPPRWRSLAPESERRTA